MSTRYYKASYAGLNDPELASQCEMYLLTSAVPAILAEAEDAPDHAARLAWARIVEADPFRRKLVVQRLQLKAIQNATLREGLADTGRAADSDVEYVGSQALPELVALGA